MSDHSRCALSLARALGRALRGTQRYGNGTDLVAGIGHDYWHVASARCAAQQQPCNFARCGQMPPSSAMQLLQDMSTAVHGISTGRINAFEARSIVSQPPVDEQRQIEGTQLQDWQQQQQALSAATPVHTGLGGSLPAASVWGGSYLQVAEQQPCPGRGSRGHLAASSGRAVVQQQGQQHTSALVLSRPRLSNSLSGPRP